MDTIRLIVNGKQVSVEVDPETPLLWVLRDTLDLPGTKFGCGHGLCGACTVHSDGVPIRSCITAVGTIHGAKITTIEGLSATGDHPVQRAWVEEDVPQCGYCQAGQIMTAAHLVKQKPHATDDEIREGMSENLCRCGTYERIRRAVRRALEMQRSAK